MNLTGWKTFQQYLGENGKGGTSNRAQILSGIPAHYRQKDPSGRWWISPKCGTLKELNSKGTPDPRHPVGAPRKTTNGKAE